MILVELANVRRHLLQLVLQLDRGRLGQALRRKQRLCRRVRAQSDAMQCDAVQVQRGVDQQNATTRTHARAAPVSVCTVGSSADRELDVAGSAGVDSESKTST